MTTELVTFPTWERYTVLSHVISQMSVRDRRHILLIARSFADMSADIFFPREGITLAEFAVWYTLGDSSRRRSKKNRDTAT